MAIEIVAEQGKCNKGQGETILCFAEWFTICPSGHRYSHSAMSRSELLEPFQDCGKSFVKVCNERFFGNGSLSGPDKLNE